MCLLVCYLDCSCCPGVFFEALVNSEAHKYIPGSVLCSQHMGSADPRPIFIPPTPAPTAYRHAAAKSCQSCPTPCDPTDGSPPVSSVPGILQARILEQGAISFSKAHMHAKSLQLCPTLCDPMDSSPPGYPAHGILQARIL